MSAKALTTTRQPELFMKQGLNEHISFIGHFKKGKARALNAGWFFIQARTAVKDNEWQDFVNAFLQSHARQANGEVSLTLRSIQFYIQFTTEALEWARIEKPGITKMETLLQIATDLVMQSPKPLVALCRELGEMRKFGEYDSVRYAIQKRLKGGAQIEFEFEKVMAPLDFLSRFGDAGVSFLYPAGKDEAEYMGEVESKLEAALKRVREVRKNGKVISV